jgi:1,4-alpha-glucan branching enzyme
MIVALQEEGVDVSELEKSLAEEQAAEASKLEAEADNPEDFWSPVAAPLPAGAKLDDYGPLSPIPEHDGTDCLKWDDSLWSHADHFKVSFTTFTFNCSLATV